MTNDRQHHASSGSRETGMGSLARHFLIDTPAIRIAPKSFPCIACVHSNRHSSEPSGFNVASRSSARQISPRRIQNRREILPDTKRRDAKSASGECGPPFDVAQGRQDDGERIDGQDSNWKASRPPSRYKTPGRRKREKAVLLLRFLREIAQDRQD
jgi:hypothetical protein